ncbi:MAG: FesM [Gemmatimonadetes bacterium]|nr:FesM [Gemmatimonadota bacterium]
MMALPVLGPFLRWRHARTVLQTALLLVALLVVVDGFTGPADASRNAAGTLPWVQWRGLVVVALLAVGNVFCMACPFMLTRRLAKRWSRPTRPVPPWLKGKAVAVGVLLLFFWSYEALDLWASPVWTAWVVLGYFGTAFAVDGLFRGAAFCKHVCPIGQFHFVHAPLSPFEVTVRDPGRCATCATKDCIRGRWAPGTGPGGGSLPVQRGCELWLFQPRKVGNVDCTFCMECIHACPHDNVGILARRPGLELGGDPVRSGVGRLGERGDLAVLAVVMTFASLINALGMVAPFVALQRRWAAAWGVAPGLVLAGALVLTLVLAPLLLVGAAAVWERARTGRASAWRRFVWGWIPFGLSMWGAHHFFHVVLGTSTLAPLLGRWVRAGAIGGAGASHDPLSVAHVAASPAAWIFPVQVLFLLAGGAWTWRLLGRIGADVHGPARAASAALPWRGLAVLLLLASIWLLAQPMEMRGMLAG